MSSDFIDTLVTVFAAVVVLSIVTGTLWVMLRLDDAKARKWEATAKKLGLKLGPREPEGTLIRRRTMSGRFDEWPVTVGIRTAQLRTTKAARSRDFTYVTAPLRPPIGTELTVRSKTLLDGVVGSDDQAQEVLIDHKRAAKLFTAASFDVGYTQELLRNDTVTDALIAAHTPKWGLFVNASSVTLETPGFVLEADRLIPCLESVVRAAQSLSEAAAQGPLPAWEQALEVGWPTLAQRHDVELDNNPPRLIGEFELHHVTVSLERKQGKEWTNVEVSFRQPLGLKLQLTKQGALDVVGKLIGRRDIEVGDEPFDKTFVLRGEPDDQAKKLFGAQVRNQILALHGQLSTLAVTDQRLSASTDRVIASEAELVQTLHSFVAVAANLEGAAPAIGPFRM